ncbi:MAG: hypothetical protein AAB075_08015, partial [Gemmatimonadota bacterium]
MTDQPGLPVPVPAPEDEKVDPGASMPPEVGDVLKGLPAEQRQVLERSFSLMYQGPAINPMLGKIDKEHLHKMLDGV